MNSNTIKLPDGRRMGYAEYGDAHGLPVLFCHGSAGSRLSVSDEMAQTLQALNVRLIAPDRPGYGLSDPMPERTLLDWPQDVSALINALGIKRFRVMGYSMGAPYALACAQALSEMVAGVSIIGGACSKYIRHRSHCGDAALDQCHLRHGEKRPGRLSRHPAVNDSRC